MFFIVWFFEFLFFPPFFSICFILLSCSFFGMDLYFVCFVLLCYCYYFLVFVFCCCWWWWVLFGRVHLEVLLVVFLVKHGAGCLLNFVLDGLVVSWLVVR